MNFEQKLAAAEIKIELLIRLIEQTADGMVEYASNPALSDAEKVAELVKAGPALKTALAEILGDRP